MSDAASNDRRTVRSVPDTVIVERNRAALMKLHHHEWEMETVSNAAHLIAEVVEHTGRPERQVRSEVDKAVSGFNSDPMRQHALDALRRALYAGV